MKHFLLSIATISLLFSCRETGGKSTSSSQNGKNGTTNAVLSSTITPVFNKTTEVFELRGTHARLIRTENGTRLHIPTSAFIGKESGVAIRGDVELTFEEYHTQGEILASGIPMKYTTPEDETVDFESAGMFNIRAFQDGAELELAEGKEIQVELATDAEGMYEFYAFNEVSSNWDLKVENCVPIPNPYIAKQKAELKKLEDETPPVPKRLIKYKAGDPLFDIKRYGASDEVMDALNGVFWKFTGDSTQIDPSKDNITFNNNFDFVELKLVDSSNVREYDMVFQTKFQQVTVRAAPIFQGKLLTRENDRMARIINQIEYALKSKAQIEKEMAQEKVLMRTMNIDGMGIYNYDRQMKDPGAIAFSAEFTFDGKTMDQAVAIYLLPKEKRCVIKYTPLTFDAFMINPKETNRILAVFEDNTVYALSSQEIKKLNLGRKKPGEKVVFDLKKHGELIENSEEVDDLIATL